MHIERWIGTSTDPGLVFGYLSDFENSTEWDPGTVRTVRETGDGGVGTRYLNTSTFLGRTAEVHYTVTELVPGSQITLRGENASLVAHDTITVTPDPAGGAQVHYRAEFAFRGWVRFLRPLLAVALRRLGDHAQREMTRALDRL